MILLLAVLFLLVFMEKFTELRNDRKKELMQKRKRGTKNEEDSKRNY